MGSNQYETSGTTIRLSLETVVRDIVRDELRAQRVEAALGSVTAKEAVDRPFRGVLAAEARKALARGDTVSADLLARLYRDLYGVPLE